jgi:hypothetical protein
MDFSFVFWVYVFINLMLSGLVAYVASEKGRDALAFFGISFLFSFLVGILVVLALPNKVQNMNRPSGANPENYGLEDYFDCPSCAEQVKLAAKICKYCGTGLEQASKELLTAAKVEHERNLKLQEEATQKAVDEILAQRLARRTKLENFAKSKSLKILLIVGALIGLGALIWSLLNPPVQKEWEIKTGTAPNSSFDLTSEWISALQSCDFSPTYGQASSERIYETDSGRVLWSIVQNSDSVSLDIDIWNSEREKIECVSKKIFGTTLASVREGSPRLYSNGFSQGVEASTTYEGGAKASGYYFRWSR